MVFESQVAGGVDMPLVNIALLTRSLYDIAHARISLNNRIRAYNLQTDTDWKSRKKTLEHLEYEYEKHLEKQLEQTTYSPMLDVKGIGSRTVGGLIMHLIETERIEDSNGKYKQTLFHNTLKHFDGVRSLWHYAGFHLRCKHCGLAENKCECDNAEFVAAKKRRGLPVDWNETFRQWLLGVSSQLIRCMNGPYRQIYEEERAKSEEYHPDWSKGHHFNHAKRLMVKQLLKDFYGNFLSPETQSSIESQLYIGFSLQSACESHLNYGRENAENLADAVTVLNNIQRVKAK